MNGVDSLERRISEELETLSDSIERLQFLMYEISSILNSDGKTSMKKGLHRFGRTSPGRTVGGKSLKLGGGLTTGRKGSLACTCCW